MKKIFLILIVCSPAFSQDLPLWFKISGNWQVSTIAEKNYLFDKYSKSIKFGYNDLINQNAVISFSKHKFDKLKVSAELYNPVTDTNFFSILFNSKDNSLKDFYAVRLYAGKKSVEKVVILKSKIKDPTLSFTEKNNFTLTELASKKCSLPFSEKFDIEIRTDDGYVTVLVNGKKVIKYELELSSEESTFGFYHTNNLVKVYSFKAYLDDTEVFADDFSTDRIKRNTVKATVTPK